MITTALSDKYFLELVKTYSTPLYVYNAASIIQQYNKIKNFFTWPKTTFYYAMKANYNPTILKLIKNQGARIDAVSVVEIHLALLCGFSQQQILFTANNITDDEMREAQELGVLFNIDSLSRLEKYGQKYPQSKVCIRLNPNVVAGAHKFVRTGGDASKFGITLDKIDKLLSIIKKYGLKIVGIHEHTGSGIPETVDMEKGMENILEQITPERFPDLEFIDFGGGFKISYHPNEKQIDYTEFGKNTSELFAAFCTSYGRELAMYFEPGRYLVAPSGTLLVEVTTIKKNKDITIAGVNSGFPQLIRPMFYGAYHHIRNITNPQGKQETYNILGNICESGDCFAENRLISEIHEGDILAIETAGAYCYSMGGIYNLHSMPTEVVVNNEKIISINKSITNEELSRQIYTKNLEK